MSNGRFKKDLRLLSRLRPQYGLRLRLPLTRVADQPANVVGGVNPS
jgi:hypothetical protein